MIYNKIRKETTRKKTTQRDSNKFEFGELFWEEMKYDLHRNDNKGYEGSI